jgi:hypothetical protein
MKLGSPQISFPYSVLNQAFGLVRKALDPALNYGLVGSQHNSYSFQDPKTIPYTIV